MEPHKVGISGIYKKKYPIEVFDSFQSPQNVDPLLFSQLCVYYYTDIRQAVVNEVIEGDYRCVTAVRDAECIWWAHQGHDLSHMH